MDNPNTFFNYYGRFFQKFWEDFVDWPRDNIVVAGIATIAPPLVVYLRNPHVAPDWELLKTTLWFYLALLGAYTILQLIRTPWKIDTEKSLAFSTLQGENTGLLNEKREFDEAKPNIILREPDARHIQDIPLSDGRVIIRIVPFVKVRFVNRPAKHTESAIAHGVSAKIKFFNVAGQMVLEMDGRWDDKDQPSLRQSTQSKRDLLLADFNFEEERNLDIAFFDTTSNEFVAFNNDNYNYQSQKKPEHVLKGDQFRVEIRLVAVHVDVIYSLVFTTTGRSDDPVAVLGETI